MQPFFFGESTRQLFGMYHAPEVRSGRNQAIVLCHPLGHEYLRAHRAFRNLAAALATQGWHVLRFDYLGSGDSSGDGDLVTVSQCVTDIGTAIDELKDISGASRVSMLGLRLGATFAEVVASGRTDIDRLVTWDPVPDGRPYAESLAALQQQWLDDRLGPGAAGAVSESEMIGFPLTETMRRELATLQLKPVARKGAPPVAMFVSEDLPAYRRLADDMAAAGRLASYDVIVGAGEWQVVDQVHQILLPHAMVRGIASGLADVVAAR